MLIEEFNADVIRLRQGLIHSFLNEVITVDAFVIVFVIGELSFALGSFY